MSVFLAISINSTILLSSKKAVSEVFYQDNNDGRPNQHNNYRALLKRYKRREKIKKDECDQDNNDGRPNQRNNCQALLERYKRGEKIEKLDCITALGGDPNKHYTSFNILLKANCFYDKDVVDILKAILMAEEQDKEFQELLPFCNFSRNSNPSLEEIELAYKNALKNVYQNALKNVYQLEPPNDIKEKDINEIIKKIPFSEKYLAYAIKVDYERLIELAQEKSRRNKRIS